MKSRTTLISIQYSTRSSQELLGRQSVRTTFKLPERSIDALSILAGQLGIKQKSLFDHLIDDIAALQVIAEESAKHKSEEQRVAKTYVISRRTLENLERVSSKYQTSRDTLVELSIERIIPLLLEEKKKHEKRKQVLKKMDGLLEETNKMLNEVRTTLAEDDPVSCSINNMADSVASCSAEIELCVERGKKIEEF